MRIISSLAYHDNRFSSKVMIGVHTCIIDLLKIESARMLYQSSQKAILLLSLSIMIGHLNNTFTNL